MNDATGERDDVPEGWTIARLADVTADVPNVKPEDDPRPDSATSIFRPLTTQYLRLPTTRGSRAPRRYADFSIMCSRQPAAS